MAGWIYIILIKEICWKIGRIIRNLSFSGLNYRGFSVQWWMRMSVWCDACGVGSVCCQWYTWLLSHTYCTFHYYYHIHTVQAIKPKRNWVSECFTKSLQCIHTFEIDRNKDDRRNKLLPRNKSFPHTAYNGLQYYLCFAAHVVVFVMW